MDSDTLGITATVFSIVIILSIAALNVYAHAECLSRGYPNASVTWTMKMYCVKRVNQTDIVMPLGMFK